MADSLLANNTNKVQVLSKIARVLDYLTQKRTPETISKMSADLGIPRGTLYRLLEVLEDEEILVQNNQGFQVGPRLLGWAVEALNSSDVSQIARPYMERLSEQFGMTVSLYIRDRGSRVCFERIEGNGLLRATVKIGERLPVHICASGLALIAWLPEVERSAVIERSKQQFPAAKVIDREPTWWHQIQQQGWVFTIGERDPELAGVSAPIFGRDDKPTASLVISGSRYQFEQFQQSEIHAMTQEIIKCTNEITRLIAGNIGR